jgi:hypothetical protein
MLHLNMLERNIHVKRMVHRELMIHMEDAQVQKCYTIMT